MSPMSDKLPPPQMCWVIEDDDAVFEVLARVIGSSGYAVVRSATLAAAMTRMTQIGDVSLVILDLKLPDGNGKDLLPWITQRQDPPDVAIMTGYATMEDAVEAMRLGVTDFVMKPFDVVDIKGMLKRVLTRQHLRVGSFLRHLEGIEARFTAQHTMLTSIKKDVDDLRDFVHAAIQRKDHA